MTLGPSSWLSLLAGRDRPLYVEPDAQSLKDAEERELREMQAQSQVVRGARVCHADFWRRVAQRSQQEAR